MEMPGSPAKYVAGSRVLPGQREDNEPNVSPDVFIFSKILEKIKESISFNAACWFHLTRTSPNNKFENGILPLGQVIESIWHFLFKLLENSFTKKEWNIFRKEIENNYPNHFADLYRTKVQKSFHWGPFAVLVRDIAFRPEESGSHDYFRTPEIIEDICVCFKEKYSIDLLEILSPKYTAMCCKIY
jgi:hypothetical protein